MHRIFLLALIFAAGCGGRAVKPAPQEPVVAKKIAILEFANKAQLSRDAAAYLPDLVRDEATRLKRGRFVIMTSENILAMLPPGSDLANCQGECSVETGRNVGADYILTGKIIKFGRTFKVSMKLYETQGGSLVAGERASAMNLEALEAPVLAAARRMLGRIKDVQMRGTRSVTQSRRPVGSPGKPSAGPLDDATLERILATGGFEKNLAARLDPAVMKLYGRERRSGYNFAWCWMFPGACMYMVGNRGHTRNIWYGALYTALFGAGLYYLGDLPNVALVSLGLTSLGHIIHGYFAWDDYNRNVMRELVRKRPQP